MAFLVRRAYDCYFSLYTLQVAKQLARAEAELAEAEKQKQISRALQGGSLQGGLGAGLGSGAREACVQALSLSPFSCDPRLISPCIVVQVGRDRVDQCAIGLCCYDWLIGACGAAARTWTVIGEAWLGSASPSSRATH